MSNLWWPESPLDMKVVQTEFDKTNIGIHVGYRKITQESLVVFADHSNGIVPYDLLENGQSLNSSNYLNKDKCIFTEGVDMKLQIQTPCGLRKGVCKRRIGKIN